MVELEYIPKKPSWFRPIHQTWNRSNILMLGLLFGGLTFLWPDISVNPNISSNGILGYFLLLIFALVIVYRVYIQKNNRIDPYHDLLTIGIDEQFVVLTNRSRKNVFT